MAKYAAFLRGINVGGRTVKMGDLKAVFTELGFVGVTTYLQSGNVIFDAEAPSVVDIEDALTNRFSYPAKVLLYRMDALAILVDACPFKEEDPDYHRYVLFFKDGLEQAFIADAVNLDPAVESLRQGDGVLYWRVKVGLTLETPVAKLLAKSKYRDFHTNRNIRTLEKMLQG